MPEPIEFRYRGARALILLHERHLPIFVDTWRRARAAGVETPPTDDPHYASMESLLRHPLASARGYMTWMCEVLGLPDPDLPDVPEPDEVRSKADTYVAELLRAWRPPLRDVPPERFRDRTYPTRWGAETTVEGMLEHAVMHPQRHSFQLEEWIEAKRSV